MSPNMRRCPNNPIRRRIRNAAVADLKTHCTSGHLQQARRGAVRAKRLHRTLKTRAPILRYTAQQAFLSNFLPDGSPYRGPSQSTYPVLFPIIQSEAVLVEKSIDQSRKNLRSPSDLLIKKALVTGLWILN
jgi:hypothetical protein